MHRNAPLTPEGRRRLCALIEDGWTISQAAESMRISRQCASKWWGRYQAHGIDGLEDHSSRPRSCPHATPARVEARVLELRRRLQYGPARLGPMLDMSPTTVYRVLRRHGLNQLRALDRSTGRVIRRIETSRPGELVHIDVKKLAVIPPGGGHRKLGREARTGSLIKRGLGYTFIHSAVDAYSRLAYSEILSAENAVDAVAFLGRATQFFAGYGIRIERVLTDNGNGYRSNDWAALCDQLGIRHSRTRPYRPATNGKVERYNRTLLEEWAYSRTWRSEAARARTLDRWLHRYNHHRHHTAIDGPPASRVTNQPTYNI